MPEIDLYRIEALQAKGQASGFISYSGFHPLIQAGCCRSCYRALSLPSLLSLRNTQGTQLSSILFAGPEAEVMCAGFLTLRAALPP